MRVAVHIPHKFPSLNDYIGAERKHRMIAAKMKHEWTAIAAGCFKNIPKIDSPASIQFIWHEENSRRDPDNIIFAKKFILDGLVTSGALENDNQKWITGLSDSWEVNKERVGVDVNIEW